MSADASWPLQQAIYAALSGDATLMGMVTGVFDHVPEDQPFPYVTLGEASVRDWSGMTFDGAEHRLTLHVWSRARGRKEAKQILDRLHALLHKAALAVAGHTLIDLRFESASALEEPDGLTYHGVARYTALTQV